MLIVYNLHIAVNFCHYVFHKIRCAVSYISVKKIPARPLLYEGSYVINCNKTTTTA